MGSNAKKHDPKFMELVRKCARLDEKTGDLKFVGTYVSAHLDFGYKGTVISVPHSHVVWFVKHGRWPLSDHNLDHQNDDPMDNRPTNLQEITHEENMAKRRGRIVYRTFGSGKYGYGIGVVKDKRDGKFYISRQLSRGHGNGDLKNVKKMLSGHDTLKEAEAAVKGYIEQIKANGDDYMPEPTKRESRHTIRLKELTPKIRQYRKSGMSLRAISDKTGFCEATIHKICKDMGIDNRVAQA